MRKRIPRTRRGGPSAASLVVLFLFILFSGCLNEGNSSVDNGRIALTGTPPPPPDDVEASAAMVSAKDRWVALDVSVYISPMATESQPAKFEWEFSYVCGNLSGQYLPVGSLDVTWDSRTGDDPRTAWGIFGYALFPPEAAVQSGDTTVNARQTYVEHLDNETVGRTTNRATTHSEGTVRYLHVGFCQAPKEIRGVFSSEDNRSKLISMDLVDVEGFGLQGMQSDLYAASRGGTVTTGSALTSDSDSSREAFVFAAWAEGVQLSQPSYTIAGPGGTLLDEALENGPVHIVDLPAGEYEFLADEFAHAGDWAEIFTFIVG